jgi:hypothetical protein
VLALLVVLVLLVVLLVLVVLVVLVVLSSCSVDEVKTLRDDAPSLRRQCFLPEPCYPNEHVPLRVRSAERDDRPDEPPGRGALCAEHALSDWHGQDTLEETLHRLATPRVRYKLLGDGGVGVELLERGN